MKRRDFLKTLLGGASALILPGVALADTDPIINYDPAKPGGDFSVITTVVNAPTRKLKAGWTTESMEDLKIVHGFDAEQEFADILSQEIEIEVKAHGTSTWAEICNAEKSSDSWVIEDESGYKGLTDLDAGYFFAPFIPLQITTIV